jgi:hypothetical protein
VLRPKLRAFSLGAILLCLAVLVSILFIAVSASLSHLNLMNSVSQGQQAKNLAESALSKAMEQIILSDYTWGRSGNENIVVTTEGLNDAEGTLTFSRTEAPDAYSTYNLESDASVVGAGNMTIPKAAIHLVARGRVGNTERWMECVFHKPPYPDGLVASGSVEASGLLLTGVKRSDGYAGGDPAKVNPEDQTPANLFANAQDTPSGKPAITLKEDCEIHGSVGSPGKIEVYPSNTIEGEILPGSEPRPLPSLDIRERIDTLNPNTVSVPPGPDVVLHENWFNHSPGALTIDGDLDLNGSALTVNGDLIINGAIKGVGVILVDGWVDIRDGGSSVVSTDQVAIAATGDVKLSASSSEGNYFQGLVYSEGNVEASNITVVGTLVTRGQNGKAGNVELKNVRFVRTPGSVQLNLTAQRGFGFGNRSGAFSITLTPAPDGETYIADVRASWSQDGDIDDGAAELLDIPYRWDEFGDTPKYRLWSNINVGKPGPNIGRELAGEIADWAGKKSKWEPKFRKILADEMNGLLDSENTEYELSFGLNNLLSEQFGEARILLWRPFER